MTSTIAETKTVLLEESTYKKPLISREPMGFFEAKGVQREAITNFSDEHYSREEFINELFEEKHKKFKGLINQLAYKANSKKGAFIQKESRDAEDYAQLYSMKIFQCIKLYWDQPKNLDTLIRTGMTALSIDFSNDRKKTQKTYTIEDYSYDQTDGEKVADQLLEMNDSIKPKSYNTASLCYQFSELSSEEDRGFDTSEEEVEDFYGDLKNKLRTDSTSKRDFDSYRKTLISDYEFNEFLDFKDSYLEEGKPLLQDTEMELLGCYLNIENYVQEGERASQAQLGRSLGMSNVKLKRGKENIIKALEIYRNEIQQ